MSLDATAGQLAFSARVSAELAASLDLDTTVERIVQLAVPFLGGFCAVDLLEEGRVVRRAEQAQADFPSALVAQLHPPAHALQTRQQIPRIRQTCRCRQGCRHQRIIRLEPAGQRQFKLPRRATLYGHTQNLPMRQRARRQ